MDEDVILDSLQPRKWASNAVGVSDSVIVALETNDPPAFLHQFQSSLRTTLRTMSFLH